MELLVQVRILAGQFGPTALARPLAAAVVAFLLSPSAGAGHPAGDPAPGASAFPSDSVRIHRSARDAQARFERLRLRFMPRGPVGGGGPCDEVVGRFCSWYGEGGDWAPSPEPEELRGHRDGLLHALDSLARHLPGDDWIAGQRVWYRAEVGRWSEALTVARSCTATGWWCDALRGLALHGAGRYDRARGAFEDALATMDPRESRWWRFPRRAVDGEGRGALEAAEEAELEGDSATARAVLGRFWLLADPLWLVPGNDRETAHYARWVASLVRVGARTPYRLSWGRDLEELTVRHGWELGWEKGWPQVGAETDVVGHKHPEGRDYLPPGSALLDPAAAPAEAVQADLTRPRSLYAPDYAPLVLPMEVQVAVFPRGERVSVVAGSVLPPDTTRHRREGHPRPWLEAGDQAGLPERVGLYLAPVGRPLEVEGGRLRIPNPDAPRPVLRSERVARSDSETLVLEAPAGRYLLSVERWSPEERRAGRYRRGLVWEGTPPDVATLSELLLVEGGAGPPASLEEAATRALPRRVLEAGTAVGVVWEIGGLGWRAARLDYTLSLRGAEGNLLQRAGRWLGLLGDDEPLRLSWEEDGPEEPGRVLRHLEVDPGAVDPGRYLLVLEVRLPGRGPLRSEVPVEIVAPQGPDAR